MYKEALRKLGRQLLPNGRAFKMPFGGFFDQVDEALTEADNRAYKAALSTLDSALPDNDNFTAADARLYERFLGLVTNEAVPIADRRKAIIRKLNHPGTIRPRQNYRFIQKSLRAAGFDVYVYENRFPDGSGGYITKTPFEILGIPVGTAILDTFELGEVELDEMWSDENVTLCVKDLEESIDETFTIGISADYKNTFYIAGPTVDSFATVSAARKNEFRQLIMGQKPTQAVAILFVNYT